MPTKQQKSAIFTAMLKTIEQVGIASFKQTSLFTSNELNTREELKAA